MIAASAGAAFKWLQIAARDLLAWIADTVSAISAVGWVLVALGTLALIWVWAGMHASTRLGPIEVTTLETDADPPGAVKALTAGFRERLSRVGLAPPPTVPDGAPQVNLIKAVEESAIPQGASIARLLEMLPSPPQPAQYKVSGTLSGQASDASCAISFWLQPLNRGVPYLDTIDGCATHVAALERAAAAIYLHIAKSTPDAFPLWVRWRSGQALDAYLKGCRLRNEGQFDEAAAWLEYAVRASPFNALAALQLANQDDLLAAAATENWPTAFLLTRALRRYIAIARLWPTLVEARYRGSVAASALATTYESLAPAEQAAIATLLPLAPIGQDLSVPLRRLADRESSATLQLLKPAYTLIRESRLRNQFEPKGHERRSLRHTVRISSHCVRMRRSNAKPNGGSWFRIRSDDARVHFVHMFLGRANVSWQGRYNAASFDALQLAIDRMTSRRRARVERRALRNLDGAIREAAGELTQAWVKHDPDFEYFHA